MFTFLKTTKKQCYDSQGLSTTTEAQICNTNSNSTGMILCLKESHVKLSFVMRGEFPWSDGTWITDWSNYIRLRQVRDIHIWISNKKDYLSCYSTIIYKSYVTGHVANCHFVFCKSKTTESFARSAQNLSYYHWEKRESDFWPTLLLWLVVRRCLCLFQLENNVWKWIYRNMSYCDCNTRRVE